MEPLVKSSDTRVRYGSIDKTDEKEEAKDEQIKMKKELGLLEGVAIILGIIIGSGIFVSPKGVLKEAGSVGLSLLVWCMCGFLSMIGALCYAELGTSIPKSGGDYAYIGEAFGSLPSFLYLWDSVFIFVPATNAIMGLTVANYLVQPFFPACAPPDAALRLIAAICITGLTWLNCWSTRVTTKLQNVFMVTKLLALGLVIVGGIMALANGGSTMFENAWEGTATDPGQIAVSFYSGIFSYAGWNYLNFMTEELKDPYTNLPRAIYISLPLVTVVYVLANVAYLAVLSPAAMLSSDAIAVTFANKMFGHFAPVMPVLIAISALGGLSCHIMTSSRLCFVGARNGHFPDCLSLVTKDRLTPAPALIFLGILSLGYLCTSDIYRLIDYASFVESMFVLISVAGLLYLRYTHPELPRPIRVTLGIPILFLLICTFLVFLPLYVRPVEVGMGLLITACGVPVYMVCIWWKNKPQGFKQLLYSLGFASQKMFMGLKEDKED
eukprot:TRINITY_DN61049_c0_g1_i1.p1 TRINITY_DN61049_c0_g1~~TRINITY_DN61049_c0_g1_i1.p1  ORF type:complete len:495 (-),score=82.18 TRINITY_DN61049_c0_g1_i1:131-1615(-)